MTGTVASIPLIASSIMCKKLAAGADAIVLDVKSGRGAFMHDLKARASWRPMMTIGGRAAGRVTAVVTDMDRPLGRASATRWRSARPSQVLARRGMGMPA